jgi:predicted 3-demethylubiquinone-9 3-methyltransferase (glyoxalase superfamily)
MQTITPFLWFDGQAEEAMLFYTSIFKDSKIGEVSRVGENGAVMMASFQLNGQNFMALNGGPEFKFNESISFFVNCDTQAEIDYLWARLSEGSDDKGQCGWIKDKFGLSWQIVPSVLGELMGGPDPVRAQRVQQALLKMTKLDIAHLRAVYEKG